MTVLLTDEQRRVEDRIDSYIRSSTQEPFVVHGLAGTGKTTLLAALARKYPNATRLAPTGKAAVVLKKKLDGLLVSTVHSYIYDFRGLHVDRADDGTILEVRPMFETKVDHEGDGAVVFLDEASMVGSRLADDLLNTGARVIAYGDPGQLPPVKDTQFFSWHDAELTTIHRQALDSAIIRQAHRIRNGELYDTDGEDFQLVRSTLQLDLTSFGAIICWKNATRRAFNLKARRVRGLEGSPVKGEPVMCLKNNYELGIFNGEIYPLTDDYIAGEGVPILKDGGRVYNSAIEGYDTTFEEMAADRDATPFALAYAITGHKSQGSEYDRVLVVDEMPSHYQDRPKWLYTAVTRGAKQVVVARKEEWGR